MLTNAQLHALQIVHIAMRAYFDAENAGWNMQMVNSWMEWAFKMYIADKHLCADTAQQIRLALNQIEITV